jgi:calcium/calmodulin-dependent protein kinase I
LLTKNPDARLTAEQALQHAWLNEAFHHQVINQENKEMLASVRGKFNPKRTFRKAVDLVRIVNSMKDHPNQELVRIIESSQAEADEPVDHVLLIN